MVSQDIEDVTDTRITPISARFRDAGLEDRFRKAFLPQTRVVLITLAVLAIFGAAVSGYGTYLSFGPDSWVFHGGLLLRIALVLVSLTAVIVYLVGRSPGRFYAWNAAVLALGCTAVALRMTYPPGEISGIASLFHVSRDGMGMLLIAALAEVVLIPAWFVVNAAIVGLALIAFLVVLYFDHAGTENPLNVALVATVAMAFILAMGGTVHRMRRQTFLVHLRLREANAQLKELARTDPLTGCANRRRFFELGRIEHERSHRYRRPLTVLFMDIDYFKSVNDRYGHAVGDQVLAAVAAAAGNELRTSDLLGRLGGEEFVILLPETDAAGGRIVAEQLRRRIGATVIAAEQGPVTVTASFGIADNSFRPADFDSLVSAADKALYEAKHLGRNRIEMSPRIASRA